MVEHHADSNLRDDDANLLNEIFRNGLLCKAGAGKTALERMLGMPRRTIIRRLPLLPMTAWAWVRAMAASLLSRMLVDAGGGELRIIATFRFVSFDDAACSPSHEDEAGGWLECVAAVGV